MAENIPGLRAALCAIALATPLIAHEGDPKLLHRKAPTPGPGYNAPRPADMLGLTLDTLPPEHGFAGQNVTLLSWLPLSSLDSAASANDCWGYVAPSGREYAIIGTSDSTVFVEITDPVNPNVVAIRPGPNSLWRDVKIYQEHAYSVSEGGSGIQVFSLVNIDNGNVPLVNTINDVGVSSTHNVAINEDSGFLYRVGGTDRGLRIYSLANPASPSFVAAWDVRYIHDVQVVSHTSGPLAGKEIAYACSGFGGGFTNTGLDILDVTNKGNIQILKNVFYPNPAYAHQGWLSADRTLFYLGDELDENGVLPTTTHIIDVSDPVNASSVGTFTNGNTAIGHNLYTVGDTIFAANYTSGMRIFDASADPLNPTEVGFFDTAPGTDGDTFNGLWSVYPYLPSGVVIGSDLESGLFVWYVGEPQLTLSLPAGAPSLLDPNGETISVEITESSPGLLAMGTEKLYFDVGAGFVEVPLVSVGGDLYEATFPSQPCGTAVTWFVSADSTANIPWSSPENAPLNVNNSIFAVSDNELAFYDMQANAGWTSGAGGDDATTGIWTRVNPVGTAAQPGDDHTPAGAFCWVTGQGSFGGSLGEEDVDGGETTLTTPDFDLSGLNEPRLSYWRWYSNGAGAGPNEDTFEIDISNNGGGSWTSVEVIGPGGPGTGGGWTFHGFMVSDFVTPTSQVRLRFRASDLFNGSIVEAGIDDLRVSDLDCMSCDAMNYCVGATTSTTSGAVMGSTGSTSIVVNTFALETSNAPANKFGVYFYGPNQIQSPFGDGFRCVGGATQRLNPLVQTDAGGFVTRPVDFTVYPTGSGNSQITPGSTWNFQLWFRDPMGPGGNGFNLSDGLSVSFCP
ncbi:MAG: choice-of-anchor B domain-containing protein [Chlamydiales bacterium]|jgi:choice-of-anchor B domain-containing protein